MLANFLSKTRPINYVFILTLLLLSFCIHTLPGYFVNFKWVNIITILANLAGLFFMVLLINFVIRKNLLTKDNSFALFLIVLFFLMFPKTMQWTNAFISNVFLLITLRRVYSLRNNTRITVKLFDAGFWLGIAFLFLNTTLIFWLILFFGMLVYGKQNIKNVLASIFGIATPVFLFYVYCLISEKLSLFNQLAIFNYSFDFTSLGTVTLILTTAVLIATVFWSAVNVTSGLQRVNQKHKATWYLMLLNLLIAIAVSIMQTEKNGSEFIFVFFPASVIIANYFQKEKDKWFKNFVIYLLFFTALSAFFL
ncbi:MAG: hypothetical protein KGZ87_04050 [Bacteroidetes bacterium]|jgi:hypothetical protein|nr:hypothetical protein [Bacteroidota bacterium]